jgi:Zn-dependent metalloprotease/chitodextrinase
MKNNFKNVFVLIVLGFITIGMTGQKQQQDPIVRTTKGLIIVDDANSSQLKSSQDIFSKYLKLSDKNNFKSIIKNSDELNFVHQKFQQFHQGIKVEFGTTTIHSKNGKTTAISGESYDIKDISIKPSLNKNQAFNRAISHIGASSYLWEDAITSKQIGYTKPKGELVLLPIFIGEGDDIKVKLAYKFDIYTTKPLSRGDLYIDAHTGTALFYNATIKHLGEHSNSSANLKPTSECTENVTSRYTPTLASGTAATRYSGSQSIETRQVSGSYVLRDNTRGNGVSTYNSGRTNSYPTTDFTDNDNNWTTAEFDNNNKDNAALDAHWGAEKTYDYWKTEHNRNSYDDNNAEIKSWVHYGNNYDNAFWNGSNMTYGDGSSNGNEGNGSFDALTSIDVAAHEIGHAVTEKTADLVYERESGALNEGYSDIWGAAVEHYAKGNGNDTNPSSSVWLIGDEIDRRNGSPALRSMSNPSSLNSPDTYEGSYWKNPNCGIPTQNNDYCGVHTNSGVLNFWFYLTTVGGSGTNDINQAYNVSGIGINKAAKIAFRNLSVYLSANSTFADARAGAITSAKDLYGAGGAEEIAVTNAWHAVGVGDPYSGGGDTQAPSTPTGLTASNITGTSVTLSWTAATDNIGVTAYNIYNGTTVATSVAATTANITGLTPNTAYQFSVKAIDAAGNVSGASNTVNITTTGGSATYCLSNGNSVNDEYISNVQIGSINKTSTGGAGGYSDFTAESTTLASGTNTITITPTWSGTEYNEAYGVWIDYNQDGDFIDPGEQVWTNAPSQTTPVSGTFTVPAGATPGATRMRVSMRYNTIPEPCGAFDYGEVEDYTVVVDNSGGDTQAPSTPTGLTASNITGTSVTLSWVAATDNIGVTAYNIYNGTTVATSVAATTANITGLTPNTAYQFSVKAIDAAGNVSGASNTVNITTTGGSATYCLSNGNSVNDEYISNVQIGSINKTSTGGAGGYSDFTAESTTLASGTNTITITPTWSGTEYNEAYGVWIDYNQDGDFIDPGEQVWTNAPSQTTPVSGTFTVPAGATPGATRMRVSMRYNTIPEPCGAFDYGEVEDYTVNIGTVVTNFVSTIPSDITFKVYPNPTPTGILNVSIKESVNNRYIIMNVVGKIIDSGTFTNKINVKNLASGLYILNVKTTDNTYTKRFIKN